jgi:hypothetical protein
LSFLEEVLQVASFQDLQSSDLFDQFLKCRFAQFLFLEFLCEYLEGLLEESFCCLEVVAFHLQMIELIDDLQEQLSFVILSYLSQKSNDLVDFAARGDFEEISLSKPEISLLGGTSHFVELVGYDSQYSDPHYVDS